MDEDDEKLGEALLSFFTSEVALPSCPPDLPSRTLWWEERDGWLYPWRIVRYVDEIAQGYPYGEPKRIHTPDVYETYGGKTVEYNGDDVARHIKIMNPDDQPGQIIIQSINQSCWS